MHNYHAATIASTEGVSICTSASPKTQTRYTAENSLILTIALCCIVACTHYDIATEERMDVRKLMKDKDTPEGVSLLYNMVSRAQKDLSIVPVLPALILSIDDIVNYIFEGGVKKQSQFLLITSKALLNAGTRSKYHTKENNILCGLRVKLTYTFLSACTIALILISVLVGLKEYEIPQDTMIVLKIEGLSVGGGGVTIGKVGYLMAMRGQKAMDKKRYQYYRDNVPSPFISTSRTEFCGWASSSPTPGNLKAVS